MFDAIKNLFGLEKTDYTDLVKNGALILDVRNQDEFKSGHIKGAMNIPINSLQQNIGKLKDKNQPIITCCASGIRSASAKIILKNSGFFNVYNGGGWANLQNKL